MLDTLWNDSIVFKYSRFWMEGEPNNGHGDREWGEEDCAHVHAQLQWNDLSCAASLQWICNLQDVKVQVCTCSGV
uniref:C-type lectin domain-containing protein n=1 Tax=Cyprinodon variegatus TaxID=28743 RepID=A0A3Q2E662_CYPVA